MGEKQSSMGWKYRNSTLPIPLIKNRLKTCPLASVRGAMILVKPGVLGRREGKRPVLRYTRGLIGEDEIACGRWILNSMLPDEHKLSPELEEQIFDWIRETL